MTRDEANNILKKLGDIGVSPDRGCLYRHEFIEACVALGMLKLDEPKSGNQLARDQFTNEGLSRYDGEIFLGAIERAGLQITKK